LRHESYKLIQYGLFTLRKASFSIELMSEKLSEYANPGIFPHLHFNKCYFIAIFVSGINSIHQNMNQST